MSAKRCGRGVALRGNAGVPWVRLGSVDPLSCPLLIEWGATHPGEGGRAHDKVCNTDVTAMTAGPKPSLPGPPVGRTTAAVET